MNIHACWWDRECREIGVPAFTYFNISDRLTIRINPVYSNKMIPVGSSPWSWHVLQIIKKPKPA